MGKGQHVILQVPGPCGIQGFSAHPGNRQTAAAGPERCLKEGNVILIRKRCGRKLMDRLPVFDMQTVYRIFDKKSNCVVY
jgi:hypothetical protein